MEGREAAIARLRPWVELAENFAGWSFDGLGARSLGPECPWEYRAVVAEHATNVAVTLDMDTGGGERLASLLHLLGRVVATEEWHVNVPVAFRRLAPLGVEVLRTASGGALPFRDASFDLVINRHGAFDPHEVARVLAPGGSFVTQQIDQRHWWELAECLPMADAGDNRRQLSNGLAEAGLAVDRDEVHEERVAYPSLGEIVYLVHVTHEWTLPDFTLERYLDELLAVEQACTTADGLVITEAHYLLVARKGRG